MKRKLGILGGTFNPIHNGHLLLAEQALEYCSLDQVLFLPSGISYMKNSEEILPGELRLSMVKLAIEDHPCFTWSDMDIRRKGYTYSADSLRELSKLYPDTELYFIIGADNLFTIETWKDPEQIFHSCILIAAVRGNKASADLMKKQKELEERFHARILLLPERIIDLSSSEIRSRIRENKSVRYMLPEKIREFIEEKKLYVR